MDPRGPGVEGEERSADDAAREAVSGSENLLGPGRVNG